MKKLFLFYFLSIAIFAQSQSLPRSTPEAEGVSSEKIMEFIDAAKQRNMEFHSFMLLRHGKVVSEGWWNPYRSDLKHTMYSVSKSFTATAVGFAVSEKLLTVDDKVISFFPDKLPAEISPNLAALRVKDLLSMSVGMEKEPMAIIIGDDWIKGFLGWKIENQPGTKFLYNSAATYMLSAIVQKVTGQRVIDYLQPRLFEPLGISGIDWETDPNGINVGGWGLRLKTEDMAKFGQLFLQKGKWNGKQILSEKWVEEASTMKILQNPEASQAKRDSSDWMQGYCYQMWRSRNNSYRGDGAVGQFIIVLPEKDAVIITTAEVQDMQAEFNLIWEKLYAAIESDKPLPITQKTLDLKVKTATLALPIASKSSSKAELTISGKNYAIDKNAYQSVSFYFKDDVCLLSLKKEGTLYEIPFGNGVWINSETNKLGPYLVERAKNNRAGLAPFKVAGSYAWKDEKTLVLTLRYIESPHTETITCQFDGDKVSLDIESLFNRNQKRIPIEGVVK